MANLVIVAIPREDDYVWKISSEKKPHCTLLFLGNNISINDGSRIRDFLEHAVSVWEQDPFLLQVDRRGVLGEDRADVVFFKMNWALAQLAQFRGWLLQNDTIRKAYDSVEQFDGWNPHLTLGYPETPARVDTREYPGIRWVEFDRIGLWTGDFEGEEYQLEGNDEDIPEVSMSTAVERGEEFITHFGVKGMKWGVRKDLQGSSRSVEVKTGHTVRGRVKVKTKGGAEHPLSPDALNLHVTRQKMKRSGTDALSNRELEELAKRMNLEQQVRSLDSKRPKTVGQKAVQEILKDPERTIKTAIKVEQTTRPLRKAAAGA